MSGAVSRKIEIARQLEEMRVLVSEQQTNLRGRERQLGRGVVEERLERQAAIVKTLEFCLANETDIRAWSAAKKGQSNERTEQSTAD